MSQIKIGIIGGTGIGQALGAEDGDRVTPDTPFGRTSSPITLAQWSGTDVAIIQRHGPGHILNPAQVPYRANIFTLKEIGCTHVVATGAVGSLREEIAPRDLVITDQIIDKTSQRPYTFYDKAAVHVDFADPFCPVSRQWMLNASKSLSEVKVHDGGTYVCMEGPAFSTKAESHMHRQWGGDLIGMTLMPEARLAREAELPYVHIAAPTDYDCWCPHAPGTTPMQVLEEILGHLKMATSNAISLIKAALSDVSILEATPSPVDNVLALAIFSDKTQIDPEEVKKLAPLWGRYFE